MLKTDALSKSLYCQIRVCPFIRTANSLRYLPSTDKHYCHILYAKENSSYDHMRQLNGIYFVLSTNSVAAYNSRCKQETPSLHAPIYNSLAVLVLPLHSMALQRTSLDLKLIGDSFQECVRPQSVSKE